SRPASIKLSSRPVERSPCRAVVTRSADAPRTTLNSTGNGQVAAWPMSPGMRGKRVSSIRMPTLAPYTVLPPWTWFRSASAILTLPLLLHPRGARRDDPLRGRECLRQGSCSDRAEGYDAPWRGTGLKETDYGRER